MNSLVFANASKIYNLIFFYVGMHIYPNRIVNECKCKREILFLGSVSLESSGVEKLIILEFFKNNDGQTSEEIIIDI